MFFLLLCLTFFFPSFFLFFYYKHLFDGIVVGAIYMLSVREVNKNCSVVKRKFVVFLRCECLLGTSEAYEKAFVAPYTPVHVCG